MKEIVYLNQCRPKLTPSGEVLDKSTALTSEYYTFGKIPTKCKVTINKTIVIDNVFVYHKDGESIFLYKSFEIMKIGFTTDDVLKNKKPWGWAVTCPKGLIIEFKSDDYVIERSQTDE